MKESRYLLFYRAWIYPVTWYRHCHPEGTRRESTPSHDTDTATQRAQDVNLPRHMIQTLPHSGHETWIYPVTWYRHCHTAGKRRESTPSHDTDTATQRHEMWIYPVTWYRHCHTVARDVNLPRHMIQTLPHSGHKAWIYPVTWYRHCHTAGMRSESTPSHDTDTATQRAQGMNLPRHMIQTLPHSGHETWIYPVTWYRHCHTAGMRRESTPSHDTDTATQRARDVNLPRHMIQTLPHSGTRRESTPSHDTDTATQWAQGMNLPRHMIQTLPHSGHEKWIYPVTWYRHCHTAGTRHESTPSHDTDTATQRAWDVNLPLHMIQTLPHSGHETWIYPVTWYRHCHTAGTRRESTPSHDTDTATQWAQGMNLPRHMIQTLPHSGHETWIYPVTWYRHCHTAGMRRESTPSHDTDTATQRAQDVNLPHHMIQTLPHSGHETWIYPVKWYRHCHTAGMRSESTPSHDTDTATQRAQGMNLPRHMIQTLPHSGHETWIYPVTWYRHCHTAGMRRESTPSHDTDTATQRARDVNLPRHMIQTLPHSGHKAWIYPVTWYRHCHTEAMRRESTPSHDTDTAIQRARGMNLPRHMKQTQDWPVGVLSISAEWKVKHHDYLF